MCNVHWTMNAVRVHTVNMSNWIHIFLIFYGSDLVNLFGVAVWFCWMQNAACNCKWRRRWSWKMRKCNFQLLNNIPNGKICSTIQCNNENNFRLLSGYAFPQHNQTHTYKMIKLNEKMFWTELKSHWKSRDWNENAKRNPFKIDITMEGGSLVHVCVLCVYHSAFIIESLFMQRERTQNVMIYAICAFDMLIGERFSFSLQISANNMLKMLNCTMHNENGIFIHFPICILKFYTKKIEGKPTIY